MLAAELSTLTGKSWRQGQATWEDLRKCASSLAAGANQNKENLLHSAFLTMPFVLQKLTPGPGLVLAQVSHSFSKGSLNPRALHYKSQVSDLTEAVHCLCL